ncbi:hypothetical protein RHGRI_001194 [Rhododendron griersonianum]|uniref:tRNA/rRNA methyltransferase SpoU type domain-containing protein n=1 Tax=Rhododendron griersonianum TaxID=479676 RepID=A0AAV6LMW3_9ERIC|nr:hypothetical protein RHGRI_001194 [Rhododendron griersonianum]
MSYAPIQSRRRGNILSVEQSQPALNGPISCSQNPKHYNHTPPFPLQIFFPLPTPPIPTIQYQLHLFSLLSFPLLSSLLSLDFTFAAERGSCSSVINGVGEAVSEGSQNKVLQVVLVSPQIPGNTGCIARTCAASAVGLHLVGPLGFQVDDAKLKRAGLDYWPYVVVKVHDSWAEFRNHFSQQNGEKRLLAFTKRGSTIHSVSACPFYLHVASFVILIRSVDATPIEYSYRRGDWLVFGSETSGLPHEALLDCADGIRIPMVETYVRCLNLSVSVGIALYEASRQLNYEQLQIPTETCMDGDKSFIAEDIFA